MKQNRPEYNFLKDPHLINFIQSPYKIAQLLKSRRYKLKGNLLVQIDTNDSIEIDPYVLKRIDSNEVAKVLQFDSLNEKVMELIKSGCNVQEKFAEFRKSNLKYSPQGTKSTQKIHHQIHKHISSIVQDKSLPYIKGLKQFKNKIL